ncbi:MAG: sensor histidine kinase, partial [Candidatus Hodarchaeota archaeon]
RRLEGIIHEVETAESDFFLDLLSHDIKNHLQGVKMITDYYHIDETILQSSDFIERIEKNVNSIFELIFNIEKYRTVQRGGGFTHLSMKELTPIIKETMSKVTNNFPNKEIKVDLEIDESISYWINANEFIEDVLANLFSNAIKHNNKEQVEIELTISSNLIRGVDYWVVSISDNGPGISEEKRKYLFTGKLRKDGSGIGLSIVKNIIDGYNGKITVMNKEDDNGEILGAVFMILFPIAQMALEPVVT